MNYSLRHATDHDYDFLYDLFVSTMQSSITQLWGGWDGDRWDTFFRDHFNAQNYQIVIMDGHDVGALAVQRRPGEIYLDTVQVTPAHQGQGLGTALIQSLLREASSLRVPVTLQVNRVNPSRRLYERLGFTVSGQTRTHYQMGLRGVELEEDPCEDNLRQKDERSKAHRSIGCG